jgi:hypothetical protein
MQLLRLVRQLHIKIDELDSSTSSGSTRKPSKQAAKATAIEQALGCDKQEVALLGRKYAVTIQPWVEKSIFHQPYPRNALPNSPGRYATEQSKYTALVAELYGFVPEHLHEKMLKFSKEFGDQVSLLCLAVMLLTLLLSVVCQRGTSSSCYACEPAERSLRQDI